MNKNIIYSTLLFFVTFGSKAQNVTATTGGEGNVGSMNVNYTIGEAFVTSYQNGNSILTQGFHQPFYTTTGIEDNFPLGILKVFPNPTTSILQLHIEQVNLENLVVLVFDITGKAIQLSRINDQIWEIDLSGLESGYYLLIVTDKKSHKSNTFKIFKYE